MKFILCAALVGWAAMDLSAGNWPQFRGPGASGLDESAAAPVSWNVESGANVRWKAAIPGLAHASPIVWEERVYVLTAVGGGKADLKVGLYGDIDSANDQSAHEWRLLALERGSGKVVWNVLAHTAVPRVKRHTKASHANSTPATDGKRIVTILGSEGLFCFDMEGKLAWKKDLGPMDSGFFRSKSAQWGFASSPVIHDGKVVVQCDVQTNSFLAVFDLQDGKELWRTARSDVPTWSTPAVASVENKAVILVNGWHHTGGYDFATGAELWKLKGGGDIPVPTPIVRDGLGYFTSAHGGPRATRAIRLAAKGDITPENIGDTNAAIVWSRPREGTYMQTPILVGDRLFACMDNGALSCLDAKTGALVYSERLSSGSQGFTASPVSDGKNLFFASELGNVHVVPAAGAFSVVSTNSLGETCMASPALVNGTIYFRTREHLVAIGN